MRLLCAITLSVLPVFSMAVYGQDIAEPVQSIGDKVLALLESAAGASVAITLIVEFAFRFVKTKKPLSLIRTISATIRYVAHLVIKVLDFVDKVLPQNVVESEALKSNKKF